MPGHYSCFFFLIICRTMAAKNPTTYLSTDNWLVFKANLYSPLDWLKSKHRYLLLTCWIYWSLSKSRLKAMKVEKIWLRGKSLRDSIIARTNSKIIPVSHNNNQRSFCRKEIYIVFPYSYRRIFYACPRKKKSICFINWNNTNSITKKLYILVESGIALLKIWLILQEFYIYSC